MIFNIKEDELWNYVRIVKMKYEISELTELITNFVCEENIDIERERMEEMHLLSSWQAQK